MAAVPTLRDAGSLRDGRWYRLHPLTPVLRGGVVAAGVIGVSFAALWETVVLRVILTLMGIDEADQPERDMIGGFLDSVANFALLTLVIFVVVAVVIWLQWRVHVVRMDDDVIEVKRGLVFRSSRRARRDRVNAIGVRRPLIPRLLGLAKLDIQAAGSDANVVLAYLPHSTAAQVRREILEVSGPNEPDSKPEPEVVTRVVEVPLLRYFLSLMLSVETVMLIGVLLGTVFLALSSDDVVLWLGVVLALFVYVGYLADRFFRVGSFVIDLVDGDIRVSLGLLATSVETIPPHRFHAVQVSQPWPWRLVGWWRIDANLASAPGAQNKKAPATTVIVPVATTAEMLRILQLCIPGMQAEQESQALRNGLDCSNPEWREASPTLEHAVLSPPRARWLLPLSAPVNRAWRSGDVVYLRTGAWIRQLVLVPLARIQSSSVQVGPVHEALGLAAFTIHGVSGPVSTRILGLDYAEATQWWAHVSQWTVKAVAASQPIRRKSSRKVPSA